jgi:lysophospholipase L1-like esterase
MRFARRAAIIAAITLVIYLVADWSVGLYFAYRSREAPPNPAGIPGYQGESFAVPEFIMDARRAGAMYTIPGTRLLWPHEAHGRYFNIDRLPPTESFYRRTVNPPVTKPPARIVLLLGGSTIYGPDTPDDQTVASYLSTYLNAGDPEHSYVVLNAGVTALDSTLERERLAYELDHGLKPDIVVVFDGGLDIVGGVYLASPGRPVVTGRTRLGELFFKYFPINIYRWLRGWAAERAAHYRLKSVPAAVSDPDRQKRLMAEMVRVYEENQMAMARLAAGVGARFLTVLEANRYGTTYTHHTPDLDFVEQETVGRMPGLAEILPVGLRALGQAQARLQAQGIATLDLSAVFKDKTGNVFTTSTAHLNAEGSRFVAERMAQALLSGSPAQAPAQQP